jgi:hypothetical protein
MIPQRQISFIHESKILASTASSPTTLAYLSHSKIETSLWLISPRHRIHRRSGMDHHNCRRCRHRVIYQCSRHSRFLKRSRLYRKYGTIGSVHSSFQFFFATVAAIVVAHAYAFATEPARVHSAKSTTAIVRWTTNAAMVFVWCASSYKRMAIFRVPA